MKRPSNNKRTTTNTNTTSSGPAATGDDNYTIVDQNYHHHNHHHQASPKFAASELLLNNNSDSDNCNNKNNLASEQQPSVKSATAARLPQLDDRHQNQNFDQHLNLNQDNDHLDQQRVGLLDRRHESNRQDINDHDDSLISAGQRQRQQLNNNRTTFFLAANMFSSSANNNSNGGAGGGDSSDNKSKKTTSKKNNSKTSILAGSGVSLVDNINDIEAANIKTLDGQAGDDAADSAANHYSSSSSPFNPCHGKLKWITLALMGLILLLAILLIAILSFSTILDNDDRCFNQNSPFHQANSYKLFSTKTLYTTAFNYLSKTAASTLLATPTAASLVVSNYNPSSPSGQASNNNNNNLNNNNILNQNNINININQNNNNNYDKSSIHVPDLFCSKYSLESINKRLTSEEVGCRARQLYFVGRHAARLPSEHELERLIKHMSAVQARIDTTSFQASTTTTPASSTLSSADSHDGVERQQAVPNKQQQQQQQQQLQITGQGQGNKSDVVCFDPLVQFKQWIPFAEPEQGNLLTEIGAQETLAIAQRFKSMYPELFNLRGPQVHVGTTNELRTAQTAVNFISQLDNFQIDGCALDQFPSENTADKLRSRDIKNSQCYRQFLKTYTQDKLMFHHKCESSFKSNTTINHNMNLKDPSRTQAIVESVKSKLKLNKKDDELSSEETRAIYDVCKYETALTGTASIWCSLFTEKDLRLYEYLADIDDYYNSAYGQRYHALSACPVTLDILKMFFKLRTNTNIADEAHFYFTHSAVIQKIFAASVGLESDPAYKTEAILKHLSRGEAPKNRQWQTSLLTPFSANIAFTLYECPKTTPPLPDTEVEPLKASGAAASNESTEPSLNVAADSTLKVVVSLNEQPIALSGCQNFVCDLNYLFANARIARDRGCDLEDICQNNVVFT